MKINKKRILSFGGGVNSMALLVLAQQKKIHVDLVIFSDLGAEQPETYTYLNDVVIPFCKENNIEFVTVSKTTMYDDYYAKKIIPYRKFPSCADKYKVRPINKYLKERYGAKNYDTILGMDAGEPKRIRESIYPLFELGIDRDGCKKIIDCAGLPIPPKSGCYFCPNQSKKKWILLFHNNPKLFKKAEKLEKNCKAYPKYYLGQMPLEKLRLSITEQRTLTLDDKVTTCPPSVKDCNKCKHKHECRHKI